MSKSRNALRVDYEGVMQGAVGRKHGLAKKDLKGLAGRVARIVGAVEAERKKGDHRYRDLPRDRRMLEAVEAACRRHRDRCDTLVVCGIGGSALGNIALQTALNPFTYNLLPRKRRGGPRLFVMDNVDPMQFGAVLDLIGDKLNSTLFNVISKSGETAETAAQFLVIRGMLKRRLGKNAPKRRILVTTDASSGTMRRIVDSEGYESLPVPDGVGGRFSVLSAVGLFSAGMCGIDIEAMVKGAAAMDRRIKRPDLFKNPAALIAAIHYLMYRRRKRLHVMMPYSYHLKDLADWFRQLWAESLGKRHSLTGKEIFVGPTPIKALGATDQHSQVQLYREGPNDKVFTLLEVDEFDREVVMPRADKPVRAMGYLGKHGMGTLLKSECLATRKALVQSQRPTLSVRFPRISAATVGQFIMLYEAATTIAGRLLNVNPYDQPGVELGKLYTFRFMGREGYEDYA